MATTSEETAKHITCGTKRTENSEGAAETLIGAPLSRSEPRLALDLNHHVLGMVEAHAFGNPRYRPVGLA